MRALFCANANAGGSHGVTSRGFCIHGAFHHSAGGREAKAWCPSPFYKFSIAASWHLFLVLSTFNPASSHLWCAVASLKPHLVSYLRTFTLRCPLDDVSEHDGMKTCSIGIMSGSQSKPSRYIGSAPAHLLCAEGGSPVLLCLRSAPLPAEGCQFWNEWGHLEGLVSPTQHSI